MIEKNLKCLIVVLTVCCLSLTVSAQPCGPPPLPPCPDGPPPANPVPISGIEILIGAGAVLGARKMIASRKPK